MALKDHLTGENKRFSPVFTFGTVSGDGTPPDPVDVENALLMLFAETAGIAIDEAIFRGERQPGDGPGLFLRICGETPRSGRNYREFTLSLTARHPSRDELLRSICRIFAALPPGEWVKVESALQSRGVIFAGIVPSSDVVYAGYHENGAPGYFAETEFRAVVFTGAEPL